MWLYKILFTRPCISWHGILSVWRSRESNKLLYWRVSSKNISQSPRRRPSVLVEVYAIFRIFHSLIYFSIRQPFPSALHFLKHRLSYTCHTLHRATDQDLSRSWKIQQIQENKPQQSDYDYDSNVAMLVAAETIVYKEELVERGETCVETALLYWLLGSLFNVFVLSI